jgi:hypothetical protein
MAGTLVTFETYIRAESDRQFGNVVKMAGGVNRRDQVSSFDSSGAHSGR